MACDRESSAEGTATPVNSDGCVPCCNSEHILKEKGVFLNDGTVDIPAVRSDADVASDLHNGMDNAAERIVDASSSLGGSAVSPDASGLRQVRRSEDKPSLRTSMMHTSVGVSDLRTVFGSVEAADMCVVMSDLWQQRTPSPLSLSSGSRRAFSPVRRQQVETKLTLPSIPLSQRTVNRCLACRKRVGLLGFKCRCGDIFCAVHRHAEKHDCSFDYKAAGRASIAKENPLIKASKIEKI